MKFAKFKAMCVLRLEKLYLICAIGLLTACGPGTQLSQNATEFFASENPFAPIITLQGENPTRVEVFSDFQDPGAIATTLKEGVISEKLQIVSTVNPDELGNYSVSYRVFSSDGFIAQAERIVIVEDTTAPVISLTGGSEVQVERTESYSEAGANVSDNYDSELEISISGEVNTEVVGEYPIEYTATDSSGNIGESFRQVVVIDTVAPVLSFVTPLADFFVNQLNEADILVQGSCSENNVVVTVSNGVDEKSPLCAGGGFEAHLDFRAVADGSVFVRASQTDQSDNSTVIQVDGEKNTESPSVSIQNPTDGFYVNAANQNSFPVNGTCSVEGETVNVTNGMDSQPANCQTGLWNSNLSFIGVEDGPVTITATFVVQGNPAEPAVVNGIKDTAAPSVTITQPLDGFIINIAAPDMLQLGGACSEAGRPVNLNVQGVLRSPNCSGAAWTIQLSKSEIPEGNLSVSVTHSDAALNQATAGPISGYKDTIAPVITLAGANPLELEICMPYEEPLGSTAEDPGHGMLPLQIDSQDVEHLSVGTYIVSYSATDAAENTTEDERTVNYAALVVDENEYENGIDSADTLQAIPADAPGNYTLCSDIDLTSIENFSPLSNFSGQFHGQDFSISHLTMYYAENNAGLFGSTDDLAVIRNVYLVDVNINGDDRLGALVGHNDGRILNVGVIGGEVIADTDGNSEERVGGLVGRNSSSGIIEYSFTFLDLVEGDRKVGGLVGENAGQISKSFTLSNVLGRASTNAETGGLLGRMLASGNIFEAYSTGAVVVGGGTAGGLVGRNDHANTVFASFWDVDSSGISGPSSDPLRFGLDRTTIEMQTQSTYTLFGWDFVLDWFIFPDQYPGLQWILP